MCDCSITLDTLHTVVSGKYVLSLLDSVGQVMHNTIDFVSEDQDFSLIVHFLKQEEQAKLIDFCLIYYMTLKLGHTITNSSSVDLKFWCTSFTASNNNSITTIAHYSATHYMNYLWFLSCNWLPNPHLCLLWSSANRQFAQWNGHKLPHGQSI